MSKKALWFGAILPDLPLIVLTVGFVIQNRFLAPQEIPNSQLFGDVYDAYFFSHPVWIVGHNFFHAPLILLVLMVLGYWGARHQHGWGWPLFWLAVACALHTSIDIFTHRHDGPLLLFPFDWQTRFAAPISYWDPRYGGRVFALLEHLLNVVIVGYLLLTWWQRRTARRLNLSSSQS